MRTILRDPPLLARDLHTRRYQPLMLTSVQISRGLRRLARLSAVGAEAPAVALRVAGGEAPRAVVGLVHRFGDLRAGRHGPRVDGVGICGDDVAAGRAGLYRPRVVGTVPDRAEHDAAALRP